MMTRNGIRRFVFETAVIMIIAAIVIIGGYMISRNEENKRNQAQYIRDFETVLKAESYEPLNTAILKDYPDIKACYLAYDSSHNRSGYVIDIESKTDDLRSVHLLVGIDYETSEVTGIEHVYDETNPLITDETAFENVRDCLVGSIIPVAITDQGTVPDEDPEKIIMTGDLRDGTYYAQSMTADKDGYIDFVEIEVAKGEITRIQWDAFNIDPTTKRRSISSLSGAYTISGDNWATQSYKVCHKMLELQSPDKLAMKSDGTTQLVEGVTCNIRKFVELADECIGNSKAGFDKNRYFSALGNIVTRVTGKSPEDSGIVNEEGYIVISFKDNPEVFTLSKTDSEGNKKAYATIGVRLIESGYQDRAQDDKGSDNGNEGSNDDPKEPDDNREQNEQQNQDMQSKIDPGEDGKSDDKIDKDLVGSVDELPLAEISTFVDAPAGYYKEVRSTISSLNTCYKFLKDYLNWLV
ncbi:MAG: hypothetical protein K5643_03600 [Saccharofermentans sp.]|nr:hypothetical protein [Saccharofermentans sp.]